MKGLSKNFGQTAGAELKKGGGRGEEVGGNVQEHKYLSKAYTIKGVETTLTSLMFHSEILKNLLRKYK